MHFACKNQERQNVRLATQLLSETIENALKQYASPDNRALYQKTSEFIKIVNDWFDVMNSYVPVNMKNKQKSDLMKNSRHYDLKTGRVKTTPTIFQKCAMLSVKATKGLFSDLQSKNISYILTHRLNQDFCRDKVKFLGLVIAFPGLLLCNNPRNVADQHWQ